MKERLQEIGREAVTELSRLPRLILGLRIVARLKPDDRHVVYVWAGLMGFLGACAALLFKAATEGVKWLFTGHDGGHVETFAQLEPLHRLAVPAVGGLCAGLVLMLGQRFVRTRATDYMEALSFGEGHVPVRASLVRSGSALFSIASGEAIGREGPLVQLAALAASTFGRLRRMAPPRRRLLVACGAAAGIATDYHTPLAGALFVAEIVLGSLAIETLGPLLLASVVAVLTVQGIEGNEALYRFEGFALNSPWEIGLYALLGVLCGPAAHLWMRLLRRVRSAFGALPAAPWARLTLGGLLVGLLALSRPEVVGNGGGLIRGLLDGAYAWPLLLLLLGLKVAASAAAFGSGAVGGVFTPSLFVGAAGGFLFATVASTAFPGLDPGGYALAGMGGFIAAATRAPITAILMIFEMTLQYSLVPPLIAATVCAHVAARSLGVESLYGESLASAPQTVFDRDLADVDVAALMRPEPRRVALEEQLAEIASAFLRAPARELWVVEASGRFRGVVLLEDVQPQLASPELAGLVIAGDLLREDCPRLRSDQALPEALMAFTGSGYENLPVVAEGSGELVGALGRADLMLALSELARREVARIA